MNFTKLTTVLTDAVAGVYDADFLPVISNLHCMSTPRVYAILNAIVSCMDPEEFYLEVGTYQGGSLISALLGNTARAIGVDSFEEFTQTNNFDLTRSNLDRFGIGDRATLVNANFRSFFASFAMKHDRIGVYYYDGAHGYEVQLAGMEAAWQFLSPGALIVVDDFSYPEVQLAVNQFIANHINDIKPLFVFDPIHSTDETWWNGCVVLRRVR